MRRTMVVGAVILAIVAVVGIGLAAFNAGLDEGVSRQLAQSGDTQQVVRFYGHGGGYGYGRGFGFPFGLILFPLFIIGIVLLIRGAFWRGRWGGPRWWGPGYGQGGYGPPGGWGGPRAFDALAGGESWDLASRHFRDEAELWRVNRTHPLLRTEAATPAIAEGLRSGSCALRRSCARVASQTGVPALLLGVAITATQSWPRRPPQASGSK